MAEEGPDGARRTAVDKALEVLSAFPAGHAVVGVSELARSLGMTKSTVFRALGSLERSGLVERTEGRYRLGRRLHELGARVYEPLPGALHAALVPFMARLYEVDRETVNLGVLRDGEVVLLERLHGDRPLPRTLPPGSRFPAHSCALGKALLAHDHGATRQVLDRGLRPRTRDTIVDERRFTAALAGVRDVGLATGVREARPDLSCVATALLDEAGRPIAALSVGGPVGRIDLGAHATLLRRMTAAATTAARRATADEVSSRRR